MSKAPEHRRALGFTSAAKLLQSRIRSAGESRGFAVSRLVTHWEEVVGPAVAAICRPVEVKYGGGFQGQGQAMGATLTLLTTGPHAPLLEMQKPAILDRVNACYGYRAVARIRVTQTAATGFAEGQASFTPAPKPVRECAPVDEGAIAEAQGVQDTELRLALAALAANVRAKNAT